MSGRVFVVCLDTRVDMYVDHVGTCRYYEPYSLVIC